ncbi:unnamed protein product [Anisakis simplex]|uniref:Sushi domain-containing protein n=1 Tax=Anisakis simplex TaxID=6269 RepID=A0A0M3IY90_ANISI|nr:unnamed protein product [Anisakis simplex]
MSISYQNSFGVGKIAKKKLDRKTFQRNQTRMYCRIMCEESDDTTVLAKVPTWNHECNVFYTYQLQRLRDDWYLWRSGDCLNTTITFDVRCGFARDAHTYPTKMLLLLSTLCLTMTFGDAQLENEGQALENFKWARWVSLCEQMNRMFSEERTIDCTSHDLKDQCILVAPNAKTRRDPLKYKCRREAMPQSQWNMLARNSTTRLACPIGCEPDADLSVLVKTPRNNPLCQKYYTYGKYRDLKEGEWYLWVTEPCRTNITTWCRFRDIPLFVPKHKSL